MTHIDLTGPLSIRNVLTHYLFKYLLIFLREVLLCVLLNCILVAAAGFCASSGDLAAGKAEFSIALESLAETFTLSSTFDLGVTLAISWATAGVLPCGAISDDDPNGIAPKLKVTVVK